MKDILKDMSYCTGCSACYNACDIKAIQMKSNEEGFVYPKIDRNRCIHCGKCRKSCPVINEPQKNKMKKSYAAYSLDESEHKTSSSGAVFAELAKKVIDQKGYVWGAAFNEQLDVIHICVNDKNELKKLKGTKYIQSYIGNSYLKIKGQLKEGKKVLFSGTPCQIAGLKCFLRKDYSNLLCVDLICHGVPSPKVYKNYLNEISKQKVIRMNFRNKDEGISRCKLEYILDDGKVSQEDYADSVYIKGFLQNLYLRNSCFKCKFKGEERCSDITIGDFWGITEFHKKMDHELGVSAVIIHSSKGQKSFEEIENNIQFIESDVEKIKAWNSCLNQSVAYNENRSKFFEQWGNKSIVVLVDELSQENKKSKNLFGRMKGKIKKWLV